MSAPPRRRPAPDSALASCQAIATTYQGIRFRSRLEAKWAAWFDAVGWPWVYEPIDLAGYIPDFVLPFPAGPVLVEVKPCFALSDRIAQDAIARIDASAWPQEALLIGAALFGDDDAVSCGWLGEVVPGRKRLWFDDAPLFDCPYCQRITFRHGTNSYHCRRCGMNDHSAATLPHARVRDAWAMATNRVQWAAGADAR
jgi:hypothetical protein